MDKPVLEGGVKKQVVRSFYDVIDQDPKRWESLPEPQKREVADAFFDKHIIPQNPEQWETLEPQKQYEVKRAFYDKFQVPQLPDFRYDGLNPVERLATDVRANVTGWANQHPVISDLLQAPNSLSGGFVEGISAHGYDHTPLLPEGSISGALRGAGDMTGGLLGRLGLSIAATGATGNPVSGGAIGLGAYGAAEEANRQSDLYGRNYQTYDYPLMAGKTALNAAAGALPVAAAGSLPMRALTGAGMSAPFGAADIAMEQVAEQGGINLADPRYAQMAGVDGLTGAAMGALFGQRAPLRGRVKKTKSPVGLKQIERQPKPETPPSGSVYDEHKGAVRGRVSRAIKQLNPGRKARYEAVIKKRAERALKQAEIRDQKQETTPEQMFQRLATEILDHPTTRRKQLIAGHKRIANRYARRAARNPQAQPTDNEIVSMHVLDSIDKEIETRKAAGEAAKEKAKTQKTTESSVKQDQTLRIKGAIKKLEPVKETKEQANTNRARRQEALDTAFQAVKKTPEKRHEGAPQTPDNPAGMKTKAQKTGDYMTLDELFDNKAAYNAYADLPADTQKAVGVLNEQIRKGRRAEIYGYDPKTGVLTSGTGRKTGTKGDPDKLVTPVGWAFNPKTKEIKLIAYNNNFQKRQYIIPNKPGDFGMGAILPSKTPGLVAETNNVYYKPGGYVDPSDYTKHVISRLPWADIESLLNKGESPAVEARIRALLSAKGDDRVEIYNHVREMMANKEAMRDFLFDQGYVAQPLQEILKKQTSKGVDVPKIGMQYARMDGKIKKIIKHLAGCE